MYKNMLQFCLSGSNERGEVTGIFLCSSNTSMDIIIDGVAHLHHKLLRVKQNAGPTISLGAIIIA